MQLNEIISCDTNSLIFVTSRSKYARTLANELNTQLKLLRKERHTLQSGNREIKEAVTNISHDLRTPLTAVCGYLDLIDSEQKSEAVSRYISVIRERTECMKSLTEELFRYSVVSAGGELKLEKVSINAVLQESIAGFYASLVQRGITPEINMPEENVFCSADKKSLLRIFENILNNALKYSDGDLFITLTKNNKVIFENTAAALDSVSVERLFDRFYTVENARNSTGLGLAIARTLAEQMNGKINAVYCNKKLCIEITLKSCNQSALT